MTEKRFNEVNTAIDTGNLATYLIETVGGDVKELFWVGFEFSEHKTEQAMFGTAYFDKETCC